MKIKIFLIGLFVCFKFIPVAAAQELSFAQSNFVITANVNVYNVNVIKQEENIFTIGFDLSNSGDFQSGIKYGVILLDKDTQVIWDEKAYPEMITLNKDETKKKEIIYEAPIFLKGRYSLMVVSKNENGFPFGQGIVDDIELNGTGNYLKIDPGKCFLRVDGEGDGKKYNLRQGVDISSEESIRLFCQMEEGEFYEKNIDFKATTYRRTIFGEVIQKNEGSADLESGQISLSLPKAAKPQAYDVLITFFDNDGNVLSNNINVHYVLRGSSATIQNAFLDKEYYNKGDSPKMTMRWTGPADFFPDSRLGGYSSEDELALTGINNGRSASWTNGVGEGVKLVVSTYDLNEEVGERVFEKILDNSQQGGQEEIDLSSLNDDKITKIELALVDDKNSVLDEMVIPIKMISADKDEVVNQNSERWMIFVVLIILLFSFAFLIINVGKNFKGFKMIFFVFSLVSISFFGISNEVFGASFSSSKMSGGYNANGTVNLDKAIYAPGEKITGTLYASVWAGCGNGGTYVKLRWNTINHADGNVTSMQTTYSGNYGYFYHTAPSTPGRYRINFGACIAVTYCNYPATFVRTEIPVDLWYTVADPTPTNGTCGTRNTTYSTTSAAWPTGSTLCATGTANPASVAFPLAGASATWTCNGSNGGTNATCTATRAAAITNASCGNASGSYTAAETAWRIPSCSAGFPDTDIITTPFLGSGETKTWNCIGSGTGHTDASCSATRAIITYPCKNTKPSNAITCAGDNQLPTENNVSWKDVNDEIHCSNRKCEYYFQKGTVTSIEDDQQQNNNYIEDRP